MNEPKSLSLESVQMVHRPALAQRMDDAELADLFRRLG